MYKDYEDHLAAGRRNIKLWRLNNPEKAKAQRVRWQLKHKAEIKVKRRAYYLKNKARYYERQAVTGKIRRADTRQFVYTLKNKPCVDCRQSFPPVCMDFDHKENKFRNVSAMMIYSKERILEEIKKCDLVCSNCHRVRTFKRKQHVQ